DLPAAAAALTREKVSLVLVWGATALQVAHRETGGGIPIVIVSAGDPVKLGMVSSLAKPGGNITGLLSITIDLSAKRLELLKEIVPALRRIAVLLYSGSTSEIASLKATTAAANTLNLEIRPVEVSNPNEIERAIGGIGKMNVQAAV